MWQLKHMLYLWCLIFMPKITYNTQTWKLDFRVCWQGDMVQKKPCFIHMSNVLKLPWKKLTDLPCQNIASDIFQYERKTCHTLLFFCYFSPKTHLFKVFHVCLWLTMYHTILKNSKVFPTSTTSIENVYSKLFPNRQT